MTAQVSSAIRCRAFRPAVRSLVRPFVTSRWFGIGCVSHGSVFTLSERVDIRDFDLAAAVPIPFLRDMDKRSRHREVDDHCALQVERTCGIFPLSLQLRPVERAAPQGPFGPRRVSSSRRFPVPAGPGPPRGTRRGHWHDGTGPGPRGTGRGGLWAAGRPRAQGWRPCAWPRGAHTPGPGPPPGAGSEAVAGPPAEAPAAAAQPRAGRI